MASEKEERKAQKKRMKAARKLTRDMIKFAQDERFAEALATALPIYWDDYYQLETADEMDMTESVRFFDWFFFDYQHGDQPRLVELFIEEKADDLDEWQREVILGWKDTPAPGAYEFLAYDTFSKKFKMRDIFIDEEQVAVSNSGPGNANLGDVIMVRLLPVGDESIFSTTAAYIPGDEVGDLPERMAQLEAEYKEEHPQADHNQFMRAHSHLIIHHALDQAVEHGRFAVTRLDPTRVDKAVKRTAKKFAKKFKRKRKK